MLPGGSKSKLAFVTSKRARQWKQ